MTRVTVEVAGLAGASRQMARDVADPMFEAVGNRLAPLHSLTGMAGNDPPAQQWATGYDRAAPLAITAAEDVINACYRVAAMLSATARNYASAEAASTTRGRPVDAAVTAAVATLPDDTRIGLPSGVPSASAALSDADLFDATILDIGPLVDRLPDGPDIATVCIGLGDHLEAVARAHRALGNACSQLATHIDHAHSRVEHEPLELLAWTAVIQGVGAVAGFFTLGIAEAPAQAGEAAAAVRAAVAWLRELRIVHVEVAAVPGLRAYQIARDSLEGPLRFQLSRRGRRSGSRQRRPLRRGR